MYSGLKAFTAQSFDLSGGVLACIADVLSLIGFAAQGSAAEHVTLNPTS